MALASPLAMVRHDMASVLDSFARNGIADPEAVPLLLANLEHKNPLGRRYLPSWDESDKFKPDCVGF